MCSGSCAGLRVAADVASLSDGLRGSVSGIGFGGAVLLTTQPRHSTAVFARRKAGVEELGTESIVARSKQHSMSDVKRKPAGLSEAMTETQFDNGYWYTTELKVFAARLGLPSASRLRKDELEKAIRHFIRYREVKTFVKRGLTKARVRDVDQGLSLDLPVVNYTSNRQTKDFIEREAAKLEPEFERKPGTRYLLNRWREEQLSAGRRITYGHLVKQAIVLNKTKQGPLRLEHGRYINFISDFMAQNPRRSHSEAVRAWKEVKRMDAPKTYEAWAAARAKRRDRN